MARLSTAHHSPWSARILAGLALALGSSEPALSGDPVPPSLGSLPPATSGLPTVNTENISRNVIKLTQEGGPLLLFGKTPLSFSVRGDSLINGNEISVVIRVASVTGDKFVVPPENCITTRHDGGYDVSCILDLPLDLHDRSLIIEAYDRQHSLIQRFQYDSPSLELSDIFGLGRLFTTQGLISGPSEKIQALLAAPQNLNCSTASAYCQVDELRLVPVPEEISIYYAVDLSGSLVGVYNPKLAQDVASAVDQKLAARGVTSRRYNVAGFAGENTGQPIFDRFTDRLGEALEALGQLRPYEASTAIFDAVRIAVEECERERFSSHGPKRKQLVIVAITDAIETVQVSSGAVQRAVKNGVIVDFLKVNTSMGVGGQGPNASDLTSVTSSTGGRAIPMAGGADEIAEKLVASILDRYEFSVGPLERSPNRNFSAEANAARFREAVKRGAVVEIRAPKDESRRTGAQITHAERLLDRESRLEAALIVLDPSRLDKKQPPEPDFPALLDALAFLESNVDDDPAIFQTMGLGNLAEQVWTGYRQSIDAQINRMLEFHRKNIALAEYQAKLKTEPSEKASYQAELDRKKQGFAELEAEVARILPHSNINERLTLLRQIVPTAQSITDQATSDGGADSKTNDSPERSAKWTAYLNQSQEFTTNTLRLVSLAFRNALIWGDKIKTTPAELDKLWTVIGEMQRAGFDFTDSNTQENFRIAKAFAERSLVASYEDGIKSAGALSSSLGALQAKNRLAKSIDQVLQALIDFASDESNFASGSVETLTNIATSPNIAFWDTNLERTKSLIQDDGQENLGSATQQTLLTQPPRN